MGPVQHRLPSYAKKEYNFQFLLTRQVGVHEPPPGIVH